MLSQAERSFSTSRRLHPLNGLHVLDYNNHEGLNCVMLRQNLVKVPNGKIGTRLARMLVTPLVAIFGMRHNEFVLWSSSALVRYMNPCFWGVPYQRGHQTIYTSLESWTSLLSKTVC